MDFSTDAMARSQNTVSHEVGLDILGPLSELFLAPFRLSVCWGGKHQNPLMLRMGILVSGL
jgi:hypothetical protein